MQPFTLPFILSLATLLSACGTTGDYYARSKAEHDALVEAVDESAAKAAVQRAHSRIVAIRWPALIAPNARQAIVSNGNQWIAVSMLPSLASDTPPLAALPDLIEASSTNFAAEMYWSIKRLDPSVQVLLEPQLVEMDRFGAASLKPLTEVSIPADVVADLWVTTPPWQVLVAQEFQLTLQSAPVRSPGNCGLLLATIGHEPLQSAIEKVPCSAGLDARNAMQAHFLLDGEPRPRPMTALPNKATPPLSRDAVVLMKTVNYGDGGPFSASMNDYVKDSRPKGLADADRSPTHPIVSGFARLTVSGLSTIEPVEARPETLSSYLSQFDPSLADTLRGGKALTPAQSENLQLVRRLLAQELQVRGARDERIAREILGGDFGRQFRRTRDQAYSQYGKQMMKMWGGVAGALAIHSATLNATGPGLGALQASNQATDYFNQQQEAAGLAYVRSIAPSIASMGNANVSLLDQRLAIDIGDQRGLRNALIKLYKKYRRP